jgi:hypothetical protein
MWAIGSRKNSLATPRAGRVPSGCIAYPAVVILVMTEHYAMLQRNLLYTGVTRGKNWSCWSVKRRPASLVEVK